MYVILVTDRRDLGLPLRALRSRCWARRFTGHAGDAEWFPSRRHAEARMVRLRPRPWLLLTPVEIGPGERWL